MPKRLKSAHKMYIHANAHPCKCKETVFFCGGSADHHRYLFAHRIVTALFEAEYFVVPIINIKNLHRCILVLQVTSCIQDKIICTLPALHRHSVNVKWIQDTCNQLYMHSSGVLRSSKCFHSTVSLCINDGKSCPAKLR